MPHVAELAPRVLAALSQPGSRPLVLHGRSGSGKSTLLRSLAQRSDRECLWCSAHDLVNQVTEAIRAGRYEGYRSGLARDARPLCVEHLEDLRGRPRTREELRRLLEGAAARRPILLTVTSARGEEEIVDWLRPWTELFSLD